MASILERNNKLNKHKKTIEDYKEDALYREVWEDVNNEKTYNFIKRYYKYIIIAIAVIILIFFSIRLIIIHQEKKHNAFLLQYETALSKLDNKKLEILSKSNERGMTDLALVYSYFMTLNKSQLNSLIKEAKTRDFRDFAIILNINSNGNKMSLKEFEKLISKINSKKSPFYWTGKLLLAQKYLTSNKQNEALEILNEITSDKDVPVIISSYAETLK